MSDSVDTRNECGEQTKARNHREGLIYCANCENCKLVTSPKGENGQYYLRVRCAAGKWLKKLGEEKFYKYFTVARRSITECDAYIPMGEVKDYLKELKKTLPIRDEIYTPQ